MDTSSEISEFIRSVGTRARARNLLLAFLIALIAGSLSATLLLGYTRLFVFTSDILRSTLYVAVPVFLLSLTALTIRFKFSPAKAAFEADQALGLKSRLIAAFETLSLKPNQSSLAPALVEDAKASIEGKKARDVVTLDLKTHFLASLAALLIPIAVAQLPMKHASEIERIKQEKTLVAKTGIELAWDAKKLVKKAKALELPKAAHSLEELAGIGKILSKKGMNQAEAIKALTKYEDKLRVARVMQKSSSLKRTLEASRKSLGDITRSGGKGRNKPGSPSEALKDLSGLLAGGVLSLEDKQRIIEKLKKTAKGLSDEGKEGEIKKALEAAIKALKEGSSNEGNQGGASKELDPEKLAEALKMIDKGAELFSELENEMNEAEKLAQAQALAKAAKQKLLKKKQCIGQALGQGQGNMLRDYGKGSTNEADPGYTAEPLPTYDRQSKDTPFRTELYEEKYAEERLNKQGYDSRLKGVRNPKGDANFGYVRSRPGGKVESALDLVDEIHEYGQAAEDALDKQKIPREYKDFVKDYFNELDQEFNK